MTILIASDHAGFETKQKIISRYKKNHDIIDCGPANDERTDYPDYADKVAAPLLNVSNSNQVGILVCGSGQGMCMRANKYNHIRAALCWDEVTAKLSRAHNDANILCLGGRVLSFDTIVKIIDAFIDTSFEGGRHTERVRKISRF